MAENINNKITTTVELDANQAQQEIVKLNSLASDGTQEYTDDQTPVEIKLIRLNIDVSIPTNSSGGDSPNV